MYRFLMTSRLRVRRSDRGFSMIEVAVVLLIIAVIAAFAIPQVVSYMRKYRLGVGAQNVATALQRARYLATSNNTRVGVLIPAINRLDIEQYHPAGTGEPLKKGFIQLPDGVFISSDGPKQIAFDGRGIVTPLPKQSPIIRINGADGYYQLVTISPTGQVTLSGPMRDEMA